MPNTPNPEISIFTSGIGVVPSSSYTEIVTSVRVFIGIEIGSIITTAGVATTTVSITG